MTATDAGTRLIALLGHPVSHSLSPALHSAAIEATGFNAVYLAFDVTPQHLVAALDGLVAVDFLGANLTTPHKSAGLEYAQRATQEASFIGAANTLYWDDGELVADNTDAAGLSDVLADDCGVGAGDQVLIFGAGGAARATAVALGRLGASVRVRARRVDAAAAIEALARAAGGSAPAASAPRVVVNATPLGRHGERLPEDLMGLGSGRVALDLNYGSASPFLAEARMAGGGAVDGLGMLIGQAEAAFARWSGERPASGVMRRVVDSTK